MAAEVKVPEEVSNLIKPEGDAPITNPKSKAALVVVSLGADRASQIYKYLNEEDIAIRRWSLPWMNSINCA